VCSFRWKRETIPPDEVRALSASVLFLGYAVSHELWALLWMWLFQWSWQCLAAVIVDSCEPCLRRAPYNTHTEHTPIKKYSA
jgi:hypothetical protein